MTRVARYIALLIVCCSASSGGAILATPDPAPNISDLCPQRIPPGQQMPVILHGTNLSGSTFSIDGTPLPIIVDCSSSVIVQCPDTVPTGTHTLTATNSGGACSQTIVIGSLDGLSCKQMIGCLAKVLDDALAAGCISDAGVHDSLKAKLTESVASLDRTNFGAAENQLVAFDHELQAQSGKAVLAALANALIRLVIGEVIPCVLEQAKKPGCFVIGADFVVLDDTIGLAQIIIFNKGATDTFKAKLVNPPGGGEANFQGTTALEIPVADSQVIYIKGVKATRPNEPIELQCLVNNVVDDTLKFEVKDCSREFPTGFKATISSFDVTDFPNGASARPSRGNLFVDGTELKDISMALFRTKLLRKDFGIRIAAVVKIEGQEGNCEDYDAGWVQNVLSLEAKATYNTGKSVVVSLTPLPMLDAKFKKIPIAVAVHFPQSCEVDTHFDDSPFVKVPLFNPCEGNGSALKSFELTEKFRTWLFVRHRATGCYRRIHHVDWVLTFKTSSVDVDTAHPEDSHIMLALGSGTAEVGGSEGNGSPIPVMGGLIANESVLFNCK